MNPDHSTTAQENRANLLTTQDIAYIHRVLEKDFCSLEDICTILNDKQSRLKLLDNEKLYLPLINNNKMLNISTYFYYFLQCRRVMVAAGLSNPAFADTITASLVEMHRLHTGDLKRLHRQKFNRYPPLFLRILIKKNAKLDIVSIRARIGQIRFIFDALVDPASNRPVDNLTTKQDESI